MAGGTFGSYIDTDSPLHRLHPAVKAVSVIILTITAGTVKSSSGLFYFGAVFLAVLFVSKIKPLFFLRALVPLSPVLAVSFASHWFFGVRDTEYSLFIVFRLTLLIFFSSLLTFLIRTDDLTALFYRVFRIIPFTDAKGLSVSLGCALSFVPVFFSFFKPSGGRRIGRLFSVKEFLAPLAEKALSHSGDSVQAMFENFDERMRLPYMKKADYTAVFCIIILSAGGYYV
ncbi:hypothetical protein EP073_02445 [Geovibrio thiophilus]|uniref:Energy-coupling factor transporter transmembrane protein EcfT n=1 Tax=Geovibrio thiophilus TaxID=139438 RepID=A0A3R6AWS0_9BACT|nr:hypothetical protein [Geovibrio thiophilus]QAR32296.1 hypothetical protein EP073_02445 [Geovibrio thiophilus]